MSEATTFETAKLFSEIFRECATNGKSIADCAQRLSAPVVIVSPNGNAVLGKILEPNPAFEQLLGYKRETLLGKRLEQFVCQDTNDETDSLRDRLDQDDYAVITQNLVRKDETRLRVERTVFKVPGSPQLGADQHVIVVIDRVMESVIPVAGGAELSQSQKIALQMETLLRRYIRENYRQGMHPAQWSALRYFKLAPPEARSLTAFARAHHTTMGTASTTVSTLVGKGYLEKHSFRGAVNLTKKGEALLRDDPLSNVVTTLNRLSAFERDWAEFVLTTLTDSFGSGDES